MQGIGEKQKKKKNQKKEKEKKEKKGSRDCYRGDEPPS